MGFSEDDRRHRPGHSTALALVEYRYDAPFTFAGKIDKLTFKLEPFTPERSPEAGAADRLAGLPHRR